MKRNKPLPTLTKAEEEVMHIIWQLGRCLVRDIIDKLGDPDMLGTGAFLSFQQGVSSEADIPPLR